jgi:predicted nucleic acid-binding Zn ribbon protein
VQGIGSVLPVVLKSCLQRGQPRMVEVLAPFWSRIAGKAIAVNSVPVAFTAGTLTVATAAPPWAVQLRGMSEEIRRAVNDFLGAPVVKKLLIELKLDLDPGGGPAKLEN